MKSCTVKLIGSYMCKNPPIVLIQLKTDKKCQQLFIIIQPTPSYSNRYLFNTPSDIQRNLQQQHSRIYGQQLCIFFTKFSHQTLSGLVNLALAYYQNNKKQHLVNFRIYGSNEHYNYLQNCKYHLGEKTLGVSYCSWFNQEMYRLGVKDYLLYKEILGSERFSQYVNKINWKLQKQDQIKINNATKYLNYQNKYYQDQYIKIIPFFQNQNVSSINWMDKKDSDGKFKTYNHVINYLCYVKRNNNQLNQNNQYINNQNYQKITLIITYKSIQQIQRILDKKDGSRSKTTKQSQNLLDYLTKQKQQKKHKLSSIIHIIDNSQLLHCSQLYLLFNKLQQFTEFSQNNNSCINIFYGYGIKSSSSISSQNNNNNNNNNKNNNNNNNDINIHYLINSYYKSIRFYSICSKLLRFLPNITLNHYNYWKKIYDSKFVNLQQKLNQLYPNSKFIIQLYKPIHQLTLINNFIHHQTTQSFESFKSKQSFKSLQSRQSLQSPQSPQSTQSPQYPPTQFSNLNPINTYLIRRSFLHYFSFPLFSNSLQYRPDKQTLQIIKKKSLIVGYNYIGNSSSKYHNKDISIEKKKFKQFDPKIIFLGTNSKYPIPMRNVSGIIIEIDGFKGGKDIGVLLDCGAGTYEQIRDHYQPQLLQNKLINLKIIFMTHLHADHNLGILQLIRQRNILLKQQLKSSTIPHSSKLYLIFPFNMIGWIHYYCNSIENILQGCIIIFTQTINNEKINIKDQWYEEKLKQYKNKYIENVIQRNKKTKGKLFKDKQHNYINSNHKPNYFNQKDQIQPICHRKSKYQTEQSQQFYQKYIKRDGSYQQYSYSLQQSMKTSVDMLLSKYCYNIDIYKQQFFQFLQKYKIKKFKPSKVFHCPQSYGIIIEHNNGLKISYSGDCRPTDQFLKQAQKSTLMIHQATYQSNQPQRAIKRLHSTFKQAVCAGISSDSNHICLTHFGPSPFDRESAQSIHKQLLYTTQQWQYYKKNGIVACDHLEFRLSQLELVGKISKIISRLGTNKIIQKNQEPVPEKENQGENLNEEEQYENNGKDNQKDNIK